MDNSDFYQLAEVGLQKMGLEKRKKRKKGNTKIKDVQCINLLFLFMKQQKLYLFIQMIQEFRHVLKTPKLSSTDVLSKMQDMVLTSMEELLPASTDFSHIYLIYDQQLGTEKAEKVKNGQPVVLDVEEQISLNYRILQYFIYSMKQNFVNYDVYQGLEEQTQKAESTIRNHIKIQQQMKMYLEYLEAKIHRYEKQVERLNSDAYMMRRQTQLLRSRDEFLNREKITLIKNNQKLSSQIENLKWLKSSQQSAVKRGKEEEGEKFVGLIQNVKIRPEQARFCESKFNSSQASPKMKQKEGFGHLINEYDFTQKKQSTYFPNLQ